MNKNARKLIPAVAMLLVSASMLSTASYAWFSMNGTVKATGMQVKVQAPASLLISETENGTYSDVYNINEQNPKTLGHASSIDGKGIFSVNPNKVNATDGTLKLSSTSDVFSVSNDTFANSEFYGVADTVGYVDYTFWVAASGNSKLDVKLDYSTISVVSSVENDALLPALRFAVLLKSNENVEAPSASNVWCGSKNDALGDPSKNAISSTDVSKEGTDPDFTYTPTTAAVKQYVKDTNLFQLGVNGKQEVTIRIWFEGMDEACKNTNILQLKSYTITVAFASTVVTEEKP